MSDLSFENHGSIWLMYGKTIEGRVWIDEHIPEDAMRYFEAVVIEHRYVTDIANGAVADGLTVE